MPKIDILIGSNSYSSVSTFSQGLCQALRRAQVECRLFDGRGGNFYKFFYEMINNPPNLTLSFSNVNINGRSLNSKWSIPHFSYLLDPGIYYLHQLDGKNSFVSCVDRKDIQSIKKIANPQRDPLFLPHGVDRELFQKEMSEKKFDITFMGTCHDFGKIRKSWSQKFSSEIAKLLDCAQEMVLSPQGISCFEALFSLCGHIPEICTYIPILHRELDLYVTGKERVDLLRSLEDVSLHVFGKGPWKKYLPKAEIHPQIPFTKTLKICAQSKMSVNSSPRFKEGSHERPFFSLALGSLPLIGSNPYFQEFYQDEKSILFYNYGDYRGVKEKVRAYLDNDGMRKAIIEKGREITLKHHTWDARVESLFRYNII